MYFRNLPLSNWVEHEMTIEEGGDLIRLAKAASVFSGAVVASDETDDLPSDARMQVGPRLVRKEPFGGLLVG